MKVSSILNFDFAMSFLNYIKRITYLHRVKPLIDFEISMFRAVVVVGAEGADASVNFEQRVHAPLNFQPF